MNIPDCKVYVEDGNQEAFQEKVFRMGGRWRNPEEKNKICHLGANYFFTACGDLTFADDALFFIEDRSPQINYEDFMNLPEPEPELTHDQILDNYWFRSDSNGIWGRFIFYDASIKKYQRVIGGTFLTKQEIAKKFEYSPTKPEE